MKEQGKKLEVNEEKKSIGSISKRREFLKKAAYSTPVLLVLGQLTKPTKAQADSGFPSGPPDWGGF